MPFLFVSPRWSKCLDAGGGVYVLGELFPSWEAASFSHPALWTRSTDTCWTPNHVCHACLCTLVYHPSEAIFCSEPWLEAVLTQISRRILGNLLAAVCHGQTQYIVSAQLIGEIVFPKLLINRDRKSVV